MSKFKEIKIYPNKNSGSKFLANGSFVYDDVLKVNFQVIQGPNGPFVALPQTSYQKDGKTEYKKEVQTITKEASAEMNKEVLAVFNGASGSAAPTGDKPAGKATPLPF